MSTKRQEEALRLHREFGWNVVAAASGGKQPLGSWKRWQSEAIPERDVDAAFAGAERNVFVITGSVSRLLVVDCDDSESVRYWRDRLGEALEQTARVKTGKGYHFYFKLPAAVVVRGRSSRDEDCRWDIRAEGGGVVAPPSVHASGRVYRWVAGHGPEAIVDAPEELLEPEEVEGESGVESRSMLTHLLTHPPEGEGDRNNWLAKVAGHVARHIPYEDAYEQMVRDAAAKLKPPLPEDEVAKLLPSIWGAEQAKDGRAAPAQEGDDDWRAALLQPTEETGWLASGLNCILVQVREKRGDSTEMSLARWMNADLRVLGVIHSGERIYEVEVRRADGLVTEDALPATTIADARKLAGWLANHGVSIGTPDNVAPARMREQARLLRYLEAQPAEALEAVPALGWHDESEAFITHEGVIRASGPGDYESVRPEPSLREWAPYRYGHSGEEESRSVLREVLAFHHEEVAAVFGAWWAACLLKPQISEVASQFPFMALEAASESGKTTGFFSLMLQLAGSDSGNTNPTRAALRDYLSAHKSGIVWVDDLDSLEAHGELLRNVTVGGSLVKKGEGNHKQVVAQMRAGLVVSGESLGLAGQKALLDRAILLEVPSPKDRSSRGDANRPQWDDVLDLRKRHPDLTAFAGDMVRGALSRLDLVGEFRDLRPGTGRTADKLAVIRLGARLLAELSGEDWVVERADAWVTGIPDLGAENALTMRLIPLALQRTGWKSRPEGPEPSRRTVSTPAFVDRDNEMAPTVWFSPGLLADWWEREPPAGKFVDPRIESRNALVQQARALGLGGVRGEGRKHWRLATGEGEHIYWRVPEALSLTLINRSQEEEDDG